MSQQAREIICKSTTKDSFSCQNKGVKRMLRREVKTGPNKAAGSFTEKIRLMGLVTINLNDKGGGRERWVEKL